MGILIAYFLWVTSVLAVIATAWIGIADSGVANVHRQRAAAMQRSYDAAIMAEDRTATPAQAAKAATTKTETAKNSAPRAVASARDAEARLPRHRRAKRHTAGWQTAHAGQHFDRHFGPRFGWRPGQPLATDPRFALGAGAPFGGY